ncbi:hypothetical protein GIB67_030214 [Kingdonia uniflora]|uniref:Uncharacterized protein n=1 Tax=Kingdonia uniflora TaxID=39325 RepID=A0A7J7MMW2_9MAGN|nr:hypothetical protein GIB67_030214 [Kingdonia uniflora]
MATSIMQSSTLVSHTSSIPNPNPNPNTRTTNSLLPFHVQTQLFRKPPSPPQRLNQTKGSSSAILRARATTIDVSPVVDMLSPPTPIAEFKLKLLVSTGTWGVLVDYVCCLSFLTQLFVISLHQSGIRAALEFSVVSFKSKDASWKPTLADNVARISDNLDKLEGLIEALGKGYIDR